MEVKVFSNPDLYFNYRPLSDVIEKEFLANETINSDLNFVFKPKVN